MKIRLVVILIFLVVVNSFGQKQGKALVDSLLNEIPNISNDSIRVRVFKRISDEYFFINVDKALVYSQNGLELATAIKWQRAIGAFSLNMGRAYADKGHYDSCMFFYKKAYKIHKAAGDKVNLAAVLNNIGAAEQNLKSNYTKAAAYYFDALKIAEALKDDNLIALCYDNISHIYFAQSNFPEALDFGFKSLGLRKQNRGDPSVNSLRDIGNALGHIASVYTEMKEVDQAKIFYNQAIPLLEKSGDIEGLAKAYSNLSILAGEDFTTKLYFGFRAEKLWNEVNPRHLLAVHNLGNLGIAFQEASLQKSNPPKGYSHSQLIAFARIYLTKAIRLGEQTGEVSSRAHFTGALAEIQAETGDYKSAYINFRAYQKVQDSLYSQENKNRIAGLVGKREIELRDKQIQINKLELENQRKQRMGLIAGLLMIAAIGGLLYWQNVARKRANQQLLQVNAELGQANKVKARFFAILSHDLRSPVANLVNFLHLQKEEPDLLAPEIAEKHQKRITESAEMLLENMESMLLWSKGQMDNFTPQSRFVAVADLFDYIEKFFTGVPHVTFSFSNADALHVVTDEDYLKIIMQNLTNNAVKALKHVPAASIRWEARCEKDRIVLVITDNGPGASAQQLNTLYDDSAAIGIKTGLGLHLIRDLAKSIACEISVRSNTEKGMEFRLIFPAG